MSTVPAVDPPVVRLARLGFEGAVRRDTSGCPCLSPEFVAEQGQLVRILDVRGVEELKGPLGHIPAVTSVPMHALGAVPSVLAASTLIILVSNHGRRAAVAARYLESLGMSHVAAMEGGMTAWKKLGFSTMRDPASFRGQLRALPPGVGRDGRPLSVVGSGAHLTASQILEHVGEPTAVRWVKLAAFLLHGKRSCVDGRDDSGVIGTPGGDAGELLLALSVVEDLRGSPLSEEEIERLLVAQVDTFGRFYMHSDTHAMNRLIVSGYRQDPRLAPFITEVFDASEWRAFHRKPPEACRELLLEHLVRPEHMGCGHLRLAMTHPEYGVRDGLVNSFLRAFHRLRWSGAPELEWVVLGGEHVEGAVVEVVLDQELHSYTRVPLIAPQVDGLQMFVAHPQVTAHLRRETASFLVEAGLLPADRLEALAEGLARKGDHQLAVTLGHLAAGLPIYRVRFGLGPPRVEPIGSVPKSMSPPSS